MRLTGPSKSITRYETLGVLAIASCYGLYLKQRMFMQVNVNFWIKEVQGSRFPLPSAYSLFIFAVEY